MKPYIEFKKQRELGEVLSDTFGFLRNEFKPFLGLVLKISAPYLIFFVISFVLYMYTVGDIFNFDLGGAPNMNNFSPMMMVLALILFAISGILAYIFANSAAIHYIKSYVENQGNVNELEVRSNVKKTFGSFLGLGILKWIVIIFSAMLCLLPVFYFIVPMSMVFSILVFEKRDAMDSFNYSFKLIKEEYWITLATLIIVGIIVLAAGYAFSLPAAIYSIIKMGLFSGEIDPANMMSMTDPVYIILNVISYLFKFILNFISIIASVFIYFNLNERKNFTGTFETIERIGNQDS